MQVQFFCLLFGGVAKNGGVCFRLELFWLFSGIDIEAAQGHSRLPPPEWLDNLQTQASISEAPTV